VTHDDLSEPKLGADWSKVQIETRRTLSVEAHAIVRGRATYGIDVRLPDTRVARLQQTPLRMSEV